MRKLHRGTQSENAKLWSGKGVKRHTKQVSGHLNLVFMKRLLESLNYEDVKVLDRILEGFPVVGPTERSGLFPLNEKLTKEDHLPEVDYASLKFKKS